jgi:hypothetical protein
VLARPMLLTIVYMTPLLTLFVAGTLGYPAGLVGAILLTACTFLAALAVAEAIGCWQGFILGLSTLAGSIGGTVIGRADYFDYNDRIALIGLAVFIPWFLTIVLVGRTVRRRGSVAGPWLGT